MDRRFGLMLAAFSLIMGFLCSNCKENKSQTVGYIDTDSSGEGPLAAYSCSYVNPYSNGPECKEYYGGWDSETVQAECDEIFNNVSGTLAPEPCTTTGAVGSCKVVDDEEHYSITWYYSHAEAAESYCDSYYQGTWTAGETEPDAGIPDECQNLMDDAFQFMVSNNDIEIDPECTDTTCVAALATESKWIEFSPKAGKVNTGFVFYPGGSVEPHLYSGILQAVARAGIFTALVPMPGNNAISGFDRFKLVKAAHPEIEHWFLGGHSMGGIGAISYVKENGATVDGIVLWAAYGTEEFDINATELPVISIYGEYDGQATVQKIQDNKPYIPSTTLYTLIPGANHSQFGHLCQNENDNDPKITRDNQHELVVAATTHFMAGVNAGGTSINTAYNSAATEADSWCQTAQRLVVNVPEQTLPNSAMDNNITINVNDFGGTNASLDPDGEEKITVQTMFVYDGNGSSLLAPSVFVGEVWCKLKSQDSVQAALGMTPEGVRGTCADINEAVVAWALDTATEEEEITYQESGKSLTFLADSAAATGPDLLVKTEIKFAESSTSPGTYELQSPGLEVADEQSIPEEKRNVTYCKLWSPGRALMWILEQR